MSPSFPINPTWIAALIASGLVMVLPLLLALVAHRRLGVRWRYVGFGAVIFFLFQFITHNPWVDMLQRLFAPQLKASEALFFAFLFGWALSNGLCEEVGRYVGYRAFMGREEKTWRKAVMYGIGHGGLETMITGVGLLVALVLGPPSNTQALGMAVGIAWSRLLITPIHIAWSVVVLQVFRRKNIAWLWVAILTHFGLDFTLNSVNGVTLIQVLFPGLGAPLVGAGVLAVCGIVALWAIWKLRDHSTEASASVEPKPMEPGATVG